MTAAEQTLLLNLLSEIEEAEDAEVEALIAAAAQA